MKIGQSLKNVIDQQVEEAKCSLRGIPEILKGNIVGGVEWAARCRLVSLKTRTNQSDAPQGFKTAVNKVVDAAIYIGDRLQPAPPDKGPPLPQGLKVGWPK